MLGFAFGLWTGLPQRRGSGGGRRRVGAAHPAGSRAASGAGPVYRPGGCAPGPINAAAPPWEPPHGAAKKGRQPGEAGFPPLGPQLKQAHQSRRSGR